MSKTTKVQLLISSRNLGKYGEIVSLPDEEIKRLGSNVSKKINSDIIPEGFAEDTIEVQSVETQEAKAKVEDEDEVEVESKK